MSVQSVLFDAPGPTARRRHRILTVIGALGIVGVIYVVLAKMGDAGQLQGYMWKPFVTDSEVWTAYLLPGLWATIKAAALSVVFAGIFGILFGMGRLSESTWIRWPCGVVVEFFRAVPVLLMMIFLFIGWFSQAGWIEDTLAPLAAVVVALTLYNGSVIAELVRSGVHSLPKGQSEAGLSIGLTPAQTLRSIQLPQALTAMLPALIGQLVVVLKDTALGYIILYPELLTAAKTLGSAYANTLPAYLMAGAIYIVINYSLTKFASFVQAWLNRRRHSAGPVTTNAPNIVQGGAEPGDPAAAGERYMSMAARSRRSRTRGSEDDEA
jgi:glutamate transport system permease protein